MKLSDWARSQGISYLTAWRWFKHGKLPVPAYKTPSGAILVDLKSPNTAALKTVVYGRVSTYNKKEDLQRQTDRCAAFCETKGWTVDRVVREVASGMNDNRPKLRKLLESHDPLRIVVENKDRLTRFGFRYFETMLPKLGWELVVINRDESDQADLMKDLATIITSFCCRLYGMRRGYNRAKEIQSKCIEPVK